MDGTTCDDGRICDGVSTCQQGNCVTSAAPVCPDDNDPCTTAACVEPTGCRQVAVPNCPPPADAGLDVNGDASDAGAASTDGDATDMVQPTDSAPPVDTIQSSDAAAEESQDANAPDVGSDLQIEIGAQETEPFDLGADTASDDAVDSKSEVSSPADSAMTKEATGTDARSDRVATSSNDGCGCDVGSRSASPLLVVLALGFAFFGRRGARRSRFRPR
jgi:hypothetical protein